MAENQSTPPAAIDPKHFRKVMGSFATGVTIVTTKNDGELHGMTVNSLTSVSMEPRLILVCLTTGTRTALAIEARGWFVVNILQEQQTALSNRFARPSEDHYAGVNFTLNEYDLPVLPGGVGHLVCRVHRIDPGGDHIIVIGEVVKAEFAETTPLIFFRGSYSSLSNPSPAPPELNWYW